jgi:hypothetical protein
MLQSTNRLVLEPLLEAVRTLYCRSVSRKNLLQLNMDILEHLQLKALRMIVYAPWYVPNTAIRRDLQTPTVKVEIHRYSSQYSTRLSAHPNGLVVNLMEQPDNNRRLRRHLPNDQPTRFLV